jgi:hypothetical protein
MSIQINIQVELLCELIPSQVLVVPCRNYFQFVKVKQTKSAITIHKR